MVQVECPVVASAPERVVNDFATLDCAARDLWVDQIPFDQLALAATQHADGPSHDAARLLALGQPQCATAAVNATGPLLTSGRSRGIFFHDGFPLHAPV